MMQEEPDQSKKKLFIKVTLHLFRIPCIVLFLHLLLTYLLPEKDSKFFWTVGYLCSEGITFVLEGLCWLGCGCCKGTGHHAVGEGENNTHFLYMLREIVALTMLLISYFGLLMGVFLNVDKLNNPASIEFIFATILSTSTYFSILFNGDF
jgi:hypothetical protein